MSNMWEFFDGLDLQRSNYVASACTVNVPSVPQNIAFCQRAIDEEEEEDDSEREMNSNDEDALMENNENDGEEVVNNNDSDSDDRDDCNNDLTESNSNESDNSYYESFHDQMDWYHVLHTHRSQRKKGNAAPTVLDERIEYILQGIAEIIITQ